MSILEDMKKMIESIPDPICYGDKNQKYFCVVPNTLSADIVNSLSKISNIKVKPVDPQLLPDKDTIYFMPDVSMSIVKTYYDNAERALLYGTSNIEPIGFVNSLEGK